MQKISRIILLIFIGSSLILAESKLDRKEALKYISLGDKEFKAGNFPIAASYYNKARELDAENYDAVYHLAECQRYQRLYKPAQENYATIVYHASATAYPLARFWLAKMYMCNEDYYKAKKAFEKFNFKQTQYSSYHEQAEKEIKDLELILELKGKPANAIITDLGSNINDENIDNSAAFPSDKKKIMYTSPFLLSDTIIDGIKKSYYTNRLYEAKIIDSEVFPGKLVRINVEDEKDLIGTPALSKDKRRLYYTICKDTKKGRICNIYYSVSSYGQWSSPKTISGEVNSEDYISMHPMVIDHPSNNGDLLFFTSTKQEDSYGGFDIWSSIIDKNGKSSKPINLGKEVNTSGNERTPFYDVHSSRLYFSSDAYPGFGEYDIYYSEGDPIKNDWSASQNVGYPINSGSDDYYFSIKEDGTTGYLTSNRPKNKVSNNTCCDNIFKFKLIDPNSVFDAYTQITGVIVKKEISESIVYLLNSKNEIIDSTVTDILGTYTFGKLPPDESYSVLIKEDDNMLDLLAADVYKTKEDGTIIAKGGNNKESPNYFAFKKLNAEQNNISLLDFNDPELIDLEGEIAILGKVVEKKKPSVLAKNLKVFLYNTPENPIDSTLTDLRGKFKFENLSSNKDYLVKMDGYIQDLFAEMLMINSNKEVIKTSSISEKDNNGYFHFKKLPFVSSSLLEVNETIVSDDISSIKDAAIGKRFRLNNILFETGKHELLPPSYQELNKLITLLKQNENISIEIAGHTDNTGSEKTNIELSRNRAKAVKIYLTDMGISPDRLVYMGYGSITPVASNLTEDGKKLNRRVEIIIKSK